jgi:hypothetical protein
MMKGKVGVHQAVFSLNSLAFPWHAPQVEYRELPVLSKDPELQLLFTLFPPSSQDLYAARSIPETSGTPAQSRTGVIACDGRSGSPA